MIRDFFFQVRYFFSSFSFSNKKRIHEAIENSFGKPKDEAFDFESIEAYFRRKDHRKAYQILSDKTCNDLDFDELFLYIDRTNSKIGQQYLYNKLRTIQQDPEQTALDESILKVLEDQPEFRIAVQKKLDNLNHKDAFHIATLFQEKQLKPPKWHFLIKILSFASLSSLVLGFFDPIFFIALVAVFCSNFVIHYWNKNNLMRYVSSIPQLLILNGVAAQLFVNPIFKKIDPGLAKPIKGINEVKNRMTFFKLEAKLQGEFEIIAWFVFEIFKTLFLLEPLLLFGVLKRLDTKRTEIESLFKFVGHIDALISISSLRKGEVNYCFPNITEEQNAIIAQEMRHPLILNCQANSIEISDKSILLTGSNMSGKTSFIRAIGLNIITGLTINTCFAKSMSFPLLKIYSAIRISDDLMNNKSYYFEEVLRIKAMLEASKSEQKNLFLLDELFKGTNTVERIAAGKAVLSMLAKNENKVLVATHDVELSDLLDKEYALYHFSETVQNQNVGFDYQLKKGTLKNRNAIQILEINSYPKEIIEEALELSKELDKFYKLPKKN